jgi:hypothetical protein
MSVTKEDKRAIKITVAIASPIILLYFFSHLSYVDPEIARLREQSECGLARDLGKPLDDRCKEILERSDAEASLMEESECSSARKWGRPVSDRCKEIFFRQTGEYR